MGITIIQKSDLSVRKTNAKVALVLAGGAVTGGAFKVGGVKALRDASLDDLRGLPWLPDAVAVAVYEKLHSPPTLAKSRQ